MAATPPSHRDDIGIAIICAIAIEYDAVCLVVDEFWDEDGEQYGRAIGDNNTYTTGRMDKHNVVIALLPQMGKINAAAAAANLRSSYSQLELVLLVGICGGVPYYNGSEMEILLGDVVISKCVIQYDFGMKYADQFTRKDTLDDNLGKASKNIRGLLKTFETDRGLELLQTQTAEFLKQLQERAKRRKSRARVRSKYSFPGTVMDRLFEPSYLHKHHSPTYTCSICDNKLDNACDEARDATCEDLGCSAKHLIIRELLKEKGELEQDSVEEAQAPMIHIGPIASGDTIMKYGMDRDKIARDEGVIAFEMEGAGIWEEVPCVIVKGVCDYADSHKSKTWQNFAAATSAAAAKALLRRYTKTDTESLKQVNRNAQNTQTAAKSSQSYPGAVFHGPIKARNFVSGIYATGSGTITNTFN
ncbi:hypothetical protein ACSS6W_008937 [Trichoderma asperelloides]